MSPVTLTLGLILPHGVQPGISTGLELKMLQVSDRLSIVLNPRLGVFARPGNHTSGLVGSDVGLELGGLRPVTHTVSLGVHYLVSSQLESLAVDLGSGDQIPVRSIRHHVVPTFRYMFGHMPSPRVGWYTSASIGRKLSPQVDSALFYCFEVGGRVRWGRT